MTTLYLARHGETVDNVNKIMQGQTQGCVTEKGRQQACNLRDKLIQIHFDAIISSDLRRAIDTANIVAQPRKIEVEITPLLRERDWGSFTGCYIPDLKDLPFTDDIETIEQLKKRAKVFLEYIKERYNDMTVLAVGHGIINKAIQSVAYGKPMNEIERMDNAEVRIIHINL